MTGDAPHVPVPKPGAALSRLLGTLDTLAAGDRMEEWLGAYATDHDWLPNPINPLSIHVAFPDTWRGAPSRVKGVQLWPGAAIRRDVGERGLHLAHAAQWTMTMAGSGNAMHPTWVGGSLMVAGLGDPRLTELAPISLICGAKLRIGSRLFALTSLRKLNRGIPLGDTGEEKLPSVAGTGPAGYHVHAKDPAAIGAQVLGRLASAVGDWRGHVRLQEGFLIAWEWWGKDPGAWEGEADRAVEVLGRVGDALLEPHRSPAARSAARRRTRPGTGRARLVTLRYTGQVRRRGERLVVTEAPRLRLPEGASGVVLRWLVGPGEEVSKGQELALARIDGEEALLVCPRGDHRVLRRRGTGSACSDATVMMGLERLR